MALFLSIADNKLEHVPSSRVAQAPDFEAVRRWLVVHVPNQNRLPELPCNHSLVYGTATPSARAGGKGLGQLVKDRPDPEENVLGIGLLFPKKQ